MRFTVPYNTVRDVMILSVRRYWNDVEDEVKITQVEEVATATAGCTSMRRKKGEKMRPPPMPTRPDRVPVHTAIRQYASISPIVQSVCQWRSRQKRTQAKPVAAKGTTRANIRRMSPNGVPIQA